MQTQGTTRFGRSLALLGALALAFLATPAAVAQVADATLEVEVVDNGELPLPGVTATVKQTSSGLERVAVTDENGIARFAALPPGGYVIRIELAGFGPVEGGLVLRVGQRGRVKATLQQAVSDEITVTGSAPLVEVLKTDVSTNIVPEQIAQLPTQDRDFQKLAFIAPGVQRERGGFRFITNAPVLGSGGNASQATVMVDGVDYTDQALGLARTRFSQDAIREFRVVTNRFDTEVGNSAGGALSIVTRSGSNDVQGSAFAFYRADSLRAQGEREIGEQDFSRYQAGVTLGGPIVRDRAHYFLSLEYIDEDNIALFRPTGAYAGQARDIEHPFTQTLGLASFDTQPASGQLLQLRLVGEIYREENFRVGGVADESTGMDLNRDNYNLTAGHNWVLSDSMLNSLRLQAGRKKFDEPNNSDALSEYFSLGTALVTGANIVGDQTMTGDYIELRDTFNLYAGNHELKFGGSVQLIEEQWDYPVFPHGMMIYASADRSFPARYDYAVGPPETTIDTKLYGLFIQDEWRAAKNFTVSLGVRYDYDTDGNNPDFSHPLSPGERDVDDDNIQPRIGFMWDVTGDGANVVRGGAGLFTGRYLLVPSFVEQQQNGITGRTLYTRLDGWYVCLLYGIPLGSCPFPRINPASPQNSGYLLAPNIALLANSLEAPETTQASLGFARRLGNSGLVLDVEAVWAEGDKEIVVHDDNFNGTAVRPNPNYAMVNLYTNDGRSEYKAVMASLNGTIKGGHLLSASVTWSDKKNISDDFTPALNDYPADPRDLEAEWGPARGDETWRAVLSGVFRLPWRTTVAPILEYGSGQPWTRRLGYDANGDGRFSDRAAGVGRNEEDGPEYKNVSLRLTKTFALAGNEIDLIVEGFNVFDWTNYDVNSVDSAEKVYAGGVYVDNPNFGNYSATLPPREIQLGLRYCF